MARAALMGQGPTDVQFVTCVVNCDNLPALATLLESGDVEVIIDEDYPLSGRERGRLHVRTRAPGKVVITV